MSVSDGISAFPFSFGAAQSLFTPRVDRDRAPKPPPHLFPLRTHYHFVTGSLSVRIRPIRLSSRPRIKDAGLHTLLTAKMDIVLEIFDTFLFDRLYSTVLPTSSLSTFRQPGRDAVSSTFSSRREGATFTPQYSYQPASKILNFQPSDWAYRSAWPRDNIYRQATSLFLITW
jgi:hypothetical protein